MPIPTPEERIHTTIAGKYLLDRILGTGGMSVVYGGMHSWTHRPVAVKILNYELTRDSETARRCLKEARAASKLNHPNVVDVLDMGRDDDGTVYLVLELLEGDPLSSLVRRRPLSLREVHDYLLPIMDAVALAHMRGVTHRDLKPDNIFVALNDKGEVTPKLLDFGIAKVSGPEGNGTVTGGLMGTPRYMAPEQIRGKSVGPAADVWSMGVVLYRVLTQRAPFDGDCATAILADVLTREATPVKQARADLPDALAAVIDRTLRKDPRQRYANMGELLKAIRPLLEDESILGQDSSARTAAHPALRTYENELFLPVDGEGSGDRTVSPERAALAMEETRPLPRTPGEELGTVPNVASPPDEPASQTLPPHEPTPRLRMTDSAEVPAGSRGSGRRAWVLGVAAGLAAMALIVAGLSALSGGDEGDAAPGDAIEAASEAPLPVAVAPREVAAPSALPVEPGPAAGPEDAPAEAAEVAPAAPEPRAAPRRARARRRARAPRRTPTSDVGAPIIPPTRRPR